MSSGNGGFDQGGGMYGQRPMGDFRGGFAPRQGVSGPMPQTGGLDPSAFNQAFGQRPPMQSPTLSPGDFTGGNAASTQPFSVTNAPNPVAGGADWAGGAVGTQNLGPADPQRRYDSPGTGGLEPNLDFRNGQGFNLQPGPLMPYAGTGGLEPLPSGQDQMPEWMRTNGFNPFMGRR